MKKALTLLRTDLDAADYERVQHDLIVMGKQTDLSEENFATFGKIGAPGISDLDMLVLGDGASLSHYHKLLKRYIQANDKARYILCHPPVYVPTEALPCLSQVHTLQNLHFAKRDSVFAQELRCHGDSTSLDFWTSLLWFSYFLIPIARCLRYPKKHSLRTVLLLQNNLEQPHSQWVRTTDLEKNRLDTVTMCRTLALEGNTADSRCNALRSMHAMFQACLNHLDQRSELEEGSKSYRFSSIPLRRDLVIRAATPSRITLYKYGCSLTLHPGILQLIPLALSRKSTKSHPLKKHLTLLNELLPVYRRYNLPFPFPYPFQLLPAPTLLDRMRNSLIRLRFGLVP